MQDQEKQPPAQKIHLLSKFNSCTKFVASRNEMFIDFALKQSEMEDILRHPSDRTNYCVTINVSINFFCFKLSFAIRFATTYI